MQNKSLSTKILVLIIIFWKLSLNTNINTNFAAKISL
jgi:hypothetical protein